MGVPAFFRWVTNSCPQAIHEAAVGDGREAAGFAVDNLYLDLNGIIHPCTHPPPGLHIPPPTNEEQMFANIRAYIDLVVAVAAPRRLIYFAIDGVAPKAKMNQQRARRFRAAYELRRQRENRARVAEEMAAEGKSVPRELVEQTHWDHNVITPGTEFLARVSDEIKNYIAQRLACASNWRKLRAVFSDASVPQEGEHKILEFIRKQRAEVGHDPNTRHCIYGADADLIMLGLSTHEPQFFILRERLEPPRREPSLQAMLGGELTVKRAEPSAQELQVPFTLVDLGMVRQFLGFFFREANVSFPFDLENIIDDFILLCFIVGNDFLPKVPGFSIRLGGIDILLGCYRELLPSLGGYLTRQGELDLPRLQTFFGGLARGEFDLLRKVEEVSSRARPRPPQIVAPPTELSTPEALFRQRVERLNALPEEGGEAEFMFDQPENYKQNYYSRKFGVTANDYECFIRQIRRHYIEGLAWNLHYYFRGCCSWRWYFPYFYAPLVSDLCNFADSEILFELGRPFTPFEQLLAVLPPYSASALPPSLAELMLEASSPIADFYPSAFYTDLKGKAFAWLGEVILPFIDDARLESGVASRIAAIPEKHRRRNRFGKVLLLARNDSELTPIAGELRPLSDAVDNAEGVNVFLFEHESDKAHISKLLPGATLLRGEFYYKGRLTGLINELLNIALNGIRAPRPYLEIAY